MGRTSPLYNENLTLTVRGKRQILTTKVDSRIVSAKGLGSLYKGNVRPNPLPFKWVKITSIYLF